MEDVEAPHVPDLGTEAEESKLEDFDPKLRSFIAETYSEAPRASEIEGLGTPEITQKFPKSFVSVSPENPEAYKKLLTHSAAFLIGENEPDTSAGEGWVRAKEIADEAYKHELEHLKGMRETSQVEPIFNFPN